jgi:hypothetical protein
MKTTIKQGDKMVEVEFEMNNERLSILNERDYKNGSNERDEELEKLEQKMKRIQSTPDIDGAIGYWNIHREKGVKRMTKQDIANIIIPDKKHITAVTYLTKWAKGENLEAYCVWYGIRLCKLTGYPFERLHNFKGML